jgi:hypothetical protein
MNGPTIFTAEGLRAIVARTVDHRACLPTEHDTSLPDGWQNDDEQTATLDGKAIACNDCKLPMFWCTRSEDWHHVDPDATCFLIQSGWSAPFGVIIDRIGRARPATADEWVASTLTPRVEGGPNLPEMPR